MARKRMIDPSIWTDEGMAEMTPRQQLMYIGLFSNADDDGRLKGSAASIRLMLPTLYTGEDNAAIETDLSAVMAQMQKLVRYEIDGRQYLSFHSFRQWQSINRPTDSHLPPPPEGVGTAYSVPTPASLTDDSVSAHSQVKGREEKRIEGKGNARDDAPPANDPIPIQRASRAERETRIPHDFTINDSMRRWARDKVPDLDLDYAHEEFCTYWRGKGGKNLDWEQTWRNGMLKANERVRSTGSRFVSQAEINKARPGKFVGA